MYRLCFCLILLLPLQGEIVDRIAITVDYQVITELQIDEELRVTAFQNHARISTDLEARRTAADRLVAQLLVGREMQLSHYPAPQLAAVVQYLQQVRNSFNNDAAYQQALREYQITEVILERHLANQLATLSFTELRFRPNLDVPDSEIESFYTREITAWKTDHPGIPPPSLNTSRPAIVKTLSEQHTDEILDTWLEETRKHVNIIYLDTALQQLGNE